VGRTRLADPGAKSLVMPDNTKNPWKAIAIVLALVLGVVLICATLVLTGVMKLGLSLL
jgi:hypothetical protein